MHLVVVLRRPDPLEHAVARLALHQGISAYEARTRLGGELPRIVAVIGERDAANDLMRRLLADGFTAGVLAGHGIAHDADREIAGSLAFADDELEITLRNGATRAIRYANMSHALHGVRTGVQSTTVEEKTRNFSAGRAMLTGGLVMSKTQTTSSTRTNETRESFLYLYDDAGGPTVALYERRLNYAFLGTGLQPSSLANFQRVLETLARHATAMRIDTRLLKPIGLGTLPLAPAAVDAGTWKSDVAAAVLALGWG